MKKFLISILVLFLIGIGSIVFMTTNDSFLNKAAKELQSRFVKDLNVDWNKLRISSKSLSIFQREIAIKTQDSCIEYQKSRFCFKLLDVSVAINLLNPINSKITKINIDMVDSFYKAATAKSPEPLVINVNELLKSINNYTSIIKEYAPKDLFINIDKLKVENDQVLTTEIRSKTIVAKYNSSTASIDLNLEKRPLGFSGYLDYATKNLSYRSKLSIQSTNQFIFKANNEIIHPALKGPLSFDIKLSLSDDVFNFNLDKLKAQFDQEILLSSASCSVAHKYTSTIDVNCINVATKIKNKFTLMTQINARIKGILDFSKQNNLITVGLESKNTNKDILDFILKSNISVINNIKEITYEVNTFKWKLYTNKFKKLVDLLKGSEFSIPAPINTMKGSIDLFSDKLVKLNSSYTTIPFKGRINLADPKKNILDFDIDSKLHYSTSSIPKLEGEVSITQININLPPIDPLGGFPNMTSSSRINERITKNRPVKKSNLAYDIKVTSKSKQSLKLYYYLLDPYFAFSVNARIKNNLITYKIEADKDFDINYLKRSITFDKMILKTLSDDSSLDAEFNYKVSGYKIILKVIGTVDSPKLILKSYPSLPREDIISLLIFKRKSTTITANQKQSVGGTEAAIADQALSLFSIWAFASTPIDYVSYNPEQKTYSASISLPGNTSFQIGTDWESINNLTLRKQLSDTWAIETSYNPNDESAKQNLMLQKEINF